VGSRGIFIKDVMWRASTHTKCGCKFHLVWCPKWRRTLGDVELGAWVAKSVGLFLTRSASGSKS